MKSLILLFGRKLAVLFLLSFLLLNNVFSQNIIRVNSEGNNIPIREVEIVLDRGGQNEREVVQTRQNPGNLLPRNVSAEINSILLESGERIFATTRFPKVISANPKLGQNIDLGQIRVIRSLDSLESQHINHENNLENFLAGIAEIVSIPDLRSYWDISNATLLKEDNSFIDILYQNQIPSSGYILVSERNGNSTFDLGALDEFGDLIEDANLVSLTAQFDWNTVVTHQINFNNQTQWLTIFNPELFNTEIPIFGFRVFDRQESDGKIIFFARDVSAAPDNLCPIFASVGSENAGNIFENDEMDGNILNPQDINLTVFDGQGVLSLGFIQLDQDPNSPGFGNISILPNATPGIYTFEYEIEDKLDGRTDRTEVTVRIIEFLELESNAYCQGQESDELFISSDRVSGFTYRWYVNETDSNEGGQLIAEETSPRLTPPTDVDGVRYYYVVVTNDCEESLTSSVAAITVLATEAPLSTGNITECALESIQTLNANDAIATTDGIEIVWYLSADGDDRVTAPILDEIGSITYYAEAVNLATGCASVIRTPVTLTLDDCRLSINKSVDQLEIDGPTILNFTIEVTNPGTVVATDVVVTDPLTNGNEPLQLLSGDSNGDGVLDLNETWIYQTSYEVNQELIDLGLDIVNTAFVNANETGEELSTTTTIINQNSGISLSKTADKSEVSETGEVITYTLTVTNTGNTTLTEVVISDPKLEVEENVGTLSPGESKSVTASYTVTQEDIDAGSILNAASVQGEDPNGETPGDEDELETPVDQNSSISLSKTADKSEVSEAGELITYTLTVTNTGNTTLTEVVVSDPKLEVEENVGTLSPGESKSVTAGYTVTQEDIDAGSILNAASVQGEDPNGETPGDEDELETPVDQNSGIALSKTADKDEVSEAGEVITYTLTVTNTGNTTLTEVVVSDPKLGIEENVGTLSPGESKSVTAGYTVTQEDMDAGNILNAASVQGEDPNGETPGDEDELETPVDQNSGIALSKTADKDEVSEVGEVITYTLTVANTGNTTLTDVVISDPKLGVEENVGTLSPGESKSVTATYTVTQEDIDAGSILNAASVQGEDPNGETPGDEDELETPVDQNSSISLSKTADRSEVSEAGEVITYTLTVTNTGNTTLTEVVVSDPKLGIEENVGALSPGESKSVTAGYTVTQEDIDAGSILNAASVQGEDPNGDTPGDEDELETPVDQNSGISLSKTADKSEVSEAGEVITYTLTVTNTGNTTLTEVVISDPKLGVEENVGTLSPGESKSVTASYTVTQEDIDAGSILNAASVQGEDPNGGTPGDEDELETPVDQNSGIALSKTADKSEVSEAGEVITYTLTVTNTGNTTLTEVVVSDPKLGVEENVGTLSPGESKSVTAGYTVTQEDIDGGSILNAASVQGEDPNGETPGDEDELETPVDQNSGISLSKTADKSEVSEAGEVITYTLTVTNTGNTTLTEVVVSDPKLGVEENVGTLSPGESKSVTASYTVIQEDMDGGSILNAASVQGEDPNGETPGDEDELETPVDQNSGIALSKTADKSEVSAAGELITYTLTVTNTGNTTLTEVVVSDPKLGVEENVGTLSPGESKSVTASYTVTQEDELAQVPIVNVATVSGFVNSEDKVEAEDQVSVPVVCEGKTRIEGLIFNAETGLPLSGVPVTLIPQGNTSGQILLQVTKDDGRYYFTDFTPGEYLVQVQDANLNSARNLYPVESSLFITMIENCNFITKDFGYESYDGNVLGDFVWYDLNGNGIQDEWFDANDDGEVTLNVPDANGYVAFDEWEWIDFNGDGRFNGPENEGEVRKAGFGNPNNPNILVTGPNGYREELTIGILGNYRTRPNELGDYTVELIFDESLELEAEAMGNSGKVKVIPNYGGRIISDPKIECGVTTTNPFELTFTQESRVRLDVDFGVRCQEFHSPRPILANDDDLGEFRISHEGLIGNILENDLLDGQRPNPDDVDFVFTDLDGIIGLLINPNGELSLVPGLNEAREYRLRYVLSEVLDPDNNDDAFVTLRLLDDAVDMSITKTSFEVEIFEGDEFEYEIVITNNSESDAEDVEIIDDLPNGLTYISSTVNSSSTQIDAALNVTGSRLTWTVPFFPSGATMTIRVLVKADALSGSADLTITNVVTVASSGDDTNPDDNTATDTNTIKPFFIPNVITPDGDSLNDRFVIKGLGKFPSNEIIIINRYGDHVFERTNYQNDWSAEGLPAGTYFYVLVGTDTQGRSHDFKGWIQVIKE